MPELTTIGIAIAAFGILGAALRMLTVFVVQSLAKLPPLIFRVNIITPTVHQDELAAEEWEGIEPELDEHPSSVQRVKVWLDSDRDDDGFYYVIRDERGRFPSRRRDLFDR